MTTLDLFRKRQFKLLLLFALSYGLWQASALLTDLSVSSAPHYPLFLGITIISWLAWFVITVLLFGGAFVAKAKFAQALAQDEWQKHISANAVSLSYVGLSAIIGAGMLWTVMVGPIDGEIVCRVLLIIAVVMPVLIHSFLDKSSDGPQDD